MQPPTSVARSSPVLGRGRLPLFVRLFRERWAGTMLRLRYSRASKLACHFEQFQVHLCQYFHIRLGAMHQLDADWVEEVVDTSGKWVGTLYSRVYLHSLSRGAWVAYPNERRLPELFGTWYAVGFHNRGYISAVRNAAIAEENWRTHLSSSEYGSSIAHERSRLDRFRTGGGFHQTLYEKADEFSE